MGVCKTVSVGLDSNFTGLGACFSDSADSDSAAVDSQESHKAVHVWEKNIYMGENMPFISAVSKSIVF